MGADTRHVRGWIRRIASAAVAVVAVACLSGCGGGPGGASSGGIFSSATSLFGGSKKIAVAPIIGTTPQVAQQLSDALVTAGSDRGLTIVSEGSKANYTLRGYLIATTEGKGAKVTYIWDVNDAGGQRVARVSGEEVVAGRAGADPWANVDAAAHPQHRRQDRLPTRRKHAARQRFGKRSGRRLGCDTHRDGFNSAARRRLRHRRQRPMAWWWRRLPAPRATARGR